MDRKVESYIQNRIEPVEFVVWDVVMQQIEGIGMVVIKLASE